MTPIDKYPPHKVNCETREDGTILLSSGYELGPVVEKTSDWVHRWAKETPDVVFLAERHGAGWRSETYAATLDKIRAIAAALLARGLDSKTPILIMSGNGVDHGLLTLAAQYVGIPTVPVAEQYSLIQGAHRRLAEVVNLIKPAMAYVVDAPQFSEALALPVFKDVEIVATRTGTTGCTPFDGLLNGDNGTDVDAANASVGPDTIGKILMTSGSTSSPKGVLTTQQMMCVNQTQVADALPFLRQRPPRIVDWLPWNHVFGGSHNFNMMLANGGSLYIDDGKPIKGAFGRTLENLSLMTGTLSFNVPIGYAMLLGALRDDTQLCHRFFTDLDLLFYAGASLPQDVWQGLEELALKVGVTLPLMTTSWGLTETAPAAMMQHQPTDRSGIVGVPLTSVMAKLIPDNDMRCEVRVKGPNIMPGYFENPEKTRESFDDEGFFITGDAMTFLDPTRPELGLRFDGRISDDFKLLSGTWVRATALRAEILAVLAPLASDIVITGADKFNVGVMIFPNAEAMIDAGFNPANACDGMVTCPLLRDEINRRLSDWAETHAGSSTRVARALVLADPPSIADGEVTAKGNLSFSKILTLRAGLLGRLYDDGDTTTIRI